MAHMAQPLKDHWQEQKLFFSRIIAAAVIALLLTGVLVARLVQLQVVNYERFSELSQGNRFRIEPMPPNRGLILDRNGLVIAENLPNWELVAVAEEIEDLEVTLTQLEALELVDPSEHNTLRDLVRSHRGFERVKLSNLTEEQAATFAVRRHRFSGVDIQEALVRHYPFGEASAHAIGYVGSISPADLERIDRSDYAATSQIGKTGIERAYEDRAARPRRLSPAGRERARACAVRSGGRVAGRGRERDGRSARDEVADPRQQRRAVARHASAARVAGGARRAARRRRRDRSAQRRRARAREHAGIRSEPLRRRA